MKPESSYLADLVRAFSGGLGTCPRPPADLDWDAFAALALRHGVFLTLAPQIDAGEAPEAFRQKLLWALQTGGKRNSVMLLELSRFLLALEEADCCPVVLKGAALAQTVYSSPEQRLFADLDILVKKAKVDEACEILGRFGYATGNTGQDPLFFDRHHFHRILRNPAGISVEIHWALTLPRSCYRFDLDGIRSRAGVHRTATVPMRLPAPEDQLLHGVMQCIADGFGDLRRVLDAVLLLPHLGPPVELIERARDQNLATGLWMLLGLVEELTGAAVPAELRSALRPRPAVRRCLESLDLARVCLDQLARRDTGLTPLLHWLCTPDWRTASQEVWRHLRPQEFDFLDAGWPADAMPGPAKRLELVAHRARLMFRAMAYLGLGLLKRRGSPA